MEKIKKVFEINTESLMDAAVVVLALLSAYAGAIFIL